MDGQNPTRRYYAFRPRQAARCGGFIGTPTNFAVVSLFNNSTGSHLLVVRAVSVADFDGIGAFADYNLYGHLTTAVAGQVPVVSSTPTIPGVVYTDDLATLPSIFGYQFDSPAGLDLWWQYNFPIAVIEPGWSYVVANYTRAHNTQVSFVWEAIFPDELDFSY